MAKVFWAFATKMAYNYQKMMRPPPLLIGVFLTVFFWHSARAQGLSPTHSPAAYNYSDGEITLFLKQSTPRLNNLHKQKVQLEGELTGLRSEIAKLRSDNTRLIQEKSLFKSNKKQIQKNQQLLSKSFEKEALLESQLASVQKQRTHLTKHMKDFQTEQAAREKDRAYYLNDSVDRYEAVFLTQSQAAYERLTARLKKQIERIQALKAQELQKSRDPLNEKILIRQNQIETLEKEFQAASFTLQAISGELTRRAVSQTGAHPQGGETEITTSTQNRGPKTAKSGQFELFQGFFRDDLEQEFARRQEKEKKQVYYFSIASVAALLVSFIFLKKTFS